ncbi:hypothetical protein [Brevibacillus sp. H7]|uniref:hypothetical protein n=1 Tax=Brevibacillus sp. H7 TaxID=3349138 RepID=UPI0038005008
MSHVKNELMVKLIRNGVTQACGKPLKEATLDELKDEWGRFTLQNISRNHYRREPHNVMD